MGREGGLSLPLIALIGGNSGTGKTTIARLIAGRMNAALQLLDDLRLATQSMTSAATHPDLHPFDDPDYLRLRSPDEICAGLIGIGKALAPGIEKVVAHHLHVDLPLVLEGDALSPRVASQSSFDGRDRGDSVAAVFVIEREESELMRSLVSRDRGFGQLPANLQQRFARASALYGAWLVQAAEQVAIPIVPARPRASLATRVDDALTAQRETSRRT
jgi:2-phosphoglycerate kinase